MKLLKSLLLAFSMYSRIPVPQTTYQDEDGSYSFCFFPFVGIVIGLLEWIWYLLCSRMGFHTILWVCVAISIPLFITGGFHVDGFLDVTDALASYRNREEKIRILRDPHIGAFAMIGLTVVGLVYLGFLSEIHTIQGICFFSGSFVLSRIHSALAAFYIPQFDERDNLATTVAMQNKKAVLLIVWLEWLGWVYFFGGLNLHWMAMELVGSAVLFLWYRNKMFKVFGGTVGDTAGWYVVMQEVIYLIILAVMEWGKL